MSRNARELQLIAACAAWLAGWLVCAATQNAAGQPSAGGAGPASSAAKPSRVVVVHDPQATDAFKPDPERVRHMTQRAITNLTGRPTPAAAWASLVNPKDVVGIKVFSTPGPDSGTRPAVVASIIEGLLEAGVRNSNIIVWDRQRADLRRAGFMELAERYHVRVEGSANAGFDEQTFYSPDNPILGQLIFGDVEFGRKGEGVGRRSFVSKLLTQNITKLINVTPMLNHNSAGVTGHLYSLAFGSVDNVYRFENDLFKMSTAVPEIYALPSLSDRVILNVTDALVCQYQGEHLPLLHYAKPLNELRFSTDPVALDTLSLRELEKARVIAGAKPTPGITLTNQLEVLHNASLLLLGRSDIAQIQVVRE